MSDNIMTVEQAQTTQARAQTLYSQQGIQSFYLDDHALHECLVLQVNVTSRQRAVGEILSSTRHSHFTLEHISKIFNVVINKAKEIMITTTQRGVLTALQPLN